MEHSQGELLRVRATSLADLTKLAASAHLYAVVDACNAPTVPKKVMELGQSRAVSLYRGTAEEEFWDVAPYLLRVDAEVLDWMLSSNLKECWGIFVAAKADLEVVRLHFRHFLKVQAPQGEIWLFRFYDPRVLIPFLAACNREELQTFFGPVLAIGVSAPGLETVVFHQRIVDERTSATDVSNQQRYAFMFRVRTVHVEALKNQGELAFAEEVIEFLRAKHERFVEGLSDKILRQRTISALSRARTYGFRRQSSLAAFVALMFRFAPNFDQQKRIGAILRDQSIPPDWRIDEVVEKATEQDWMEVLQNSDPSQWNV